ncbi:MAG: UDP-3-O-(3-hydroxymyristoyl)glucosamine N-acyltransferase [Marinilabiliales bacterium]|nr:MAG: UDP-3-O-(3-hydroxymyristoyl)glucosamine N-acyltransferase [Marinilabiliales bacterium]
MDFPQPLHVSEIADIIGAEIKGTDNTAIGLNELHVVREGDVTFVDHPKYYNKVLNSAATVIIINKEVDPPENKTLLIHPAPFDAFNQLIMKFRPFQPSNAAISVTAKIGKNTVIQPGAFIGNNVVIGDNCIIHSNASIYDHSIIGNNVIVHSNSVIGGDGYYFQRRPQGYVKFHSGGRVILEDDVEIGACCSIDKGVTGDTIIGKGTKMDNQCQVGHDTRIGKNCLIGAYAAIAGVTVIEDDVILWARVAVNKDITIKKGAVLLATSAVDKTIEGNCTYMGSPAIEVKKYWRQYVAMKELPEFMKKFR